MRDGAVIGQEAERAWKMIQRMMVLDALSETGCGRSPDPDEGPYAYSFRADANRVLLVKRGKFSFDEAIRTLKNSKPETKEPAARWLRGELAKLRRGERIPGQAPVRRGLALSELQIADLAMTLVESCNGRPGSELLCLVRELMGINTHRAALAEKRNPAFEVAAVVEGMRARKGQAIGVRELAREVGVSAGTITKWQREPKYKGLANLWSKPHPFELAISAHQCHPGGD